MKKCRILIITVLTSLCMILIGGVSAVSAATAFSDYTFDQESGLLTVHSDVPEDAVWPGLEDGSVKEVIFDEGVTEIGYRGCNDYVFENVTKITFSSSVKKIGDLAFINLANLPPQEYVFSEGLEEIGASAFASNNANVDTLALPSTLKRIGGRAFINMTIEHVTLPSGIEYIGPGALCGVRKFDDFLGANYTCMGGCLYDKAVTKLVQYPSGLSGEYIAPATLKSIGEMAFYKTKFVTNIVLPEGFEDVEDNAVLFNGATFERHHCIFPSTLKHIGTGNFNVRQVPMGFRGTKEQWDAVDIEDRNEPHHIGSVDDEYMMFYNYDITGISLPEITLSPRASCRLYPAVFPKEPTSEEAAAGRSQFARYADWVIWSLDEDGQVLVDDSVISKTDYVDGSIVIHAKKEGEGGVSVSAYGREAVSDVHVKANRPGPGGVDPSTGAIEDVVHTGDQVQLSNGVTGADGEEIPGEYSSSDEDVATVSGEGLVTFQGVGEVTITAEYAGGMEISQEFTVEEAPVEVVAVEGISLSAKKITLKKGKKKTLKVTIDPSNATNQDVTFKSSNKKVAAVNSKGVVKARKKGKATITVITADGGKKATCKVVVK